MQQHVFETAIAAKTLRATISDLAEQASGSVMLTYDETTIFVTAVMSEQVSSAPYFPLSVEFEERFYAAGAILGNQYQRREGRPSEEAILAARIIDRTIRPLFDQSMRFEVQVVVTVLALGAADPDVLGVIGASLALGISDIPWQGPVGAVRIGRGQETDAFIVNPTYNERKVTEQNFEVLACGKAGAINMIEAATHEAPESDIVIALKQASEIHQTLTAWQSDIIKQIGKPKRPYQPPTTPAAISELFGSEFETPLYQTIFSNRSGKQHINALKADFLTRGAQTIEDFDVMAADHFFETKVDTLLHTGVIRDQKRADGRGMDEVRPLYAAAGGISPVLHGSGIFYRGGTHIFTALTLAGPGEAQTIDTIEIREGKKRFMHHYNFPPASVGETGRLGGTNRRMIGHGALAEKALRPVIPAQVDFPYTIRLVSETMASNGSSSMGSVCASTLALLDGGVPISRPVAGIASGLMLAGDNYKLLTDIQGPEDEHGDMDFKVAGTRLGVTAIQMDVKVEGISIHILTEALAAAKQARLQILDTIEANIAVPRPTLSPRAPEIVVLNIKPDQIGLVIGSGGKTINAIKEESGVDDISIEEDGTIYITGRQGSANGARQRILDLTKIYVVGEATSGTVVKLADFGAFVKLPNGSEGLVHISELAPFRIDQVNAVLQVGETIPVTVVKVENGRIGLSLKQADPTFAERKGIKP